MLCKEDEVGPRSDGCEGVAGQGRGAHIEGVFDRASGFFWLVNFAYQRARMDKRGPEDRVVLTHG